MKSTDQHSFKTAGRAITALAATLLFAAPTLAHEGDHWPLSGDSLKMSWSANGQKTKFKFKSKDQINLNSTSLLEDPTAERSTLVVRGTGAMPGTSGVIELNPAYWSRIGSETQPKGWKFKSTPYYADGVTKIQLKSGAAGGSIQIRRATASISSRAT